MRKLNPNDKMFFMDYGKVTILYFGDSNPMLRSALLDTGFTNLVRAETDESVRAAFRRALAIGGEYMVTVNEKDGFSVSDICMVADRLLMDSSALIAGARDNKCKSGFAAMIFGFLSGIDANDIRTSLFGMSAETGAQLAEMKSSEKNFMFNLLLEARAQSIPVIEIKTSAVCEESLGFDILTRSFKLYFVFLKFSIAAMIAYAVDISTFYGFEILFHSLSDEFKVLWATVLSRLLTSITTYILNRGAVFKSHAKSTGVVIRFIILSVAQLLISWLLVWGISELFGGGDVARMFIKVIVDLIIFLASFTLQRDWVFKESKGILK